MAPRVSHITISELWPLPPRKSDWHLHGNLNIEWRTSKKKDYEYKCQSQSCSSIDNIVASGCPCVIKKKGLIVTLAAMQLILRVMTWVSWFWWSSSRLWCWVVMMACSYAWLWRSYVSLCLRARSQPVQMPKIDLVHKSVHMLPREFFFFFAKILADVGTFSYILSVMVYCTYELFFFLACSACTSTYIGTPFWWMSTKPPGLAKVKGWKLKTLEAWYWNPSLLKTTSYA